MISVLKSKIHRARVTGADKDYIGSITIDKAIAKAAGLYENEKVLVADITNGNRLETYVIYGEKDSGVFEINGAAAHLIKEGDLIIVMSFKLVREIEARDFKPTILLMDENNKIKEII